MEPMKELAVPRITQEQKQANRQRIVDGAGAGFRQRGIDGFGIDEVMAAAGMTHGGFYNHFASKEELAAEVFHQGFDFSLAGVAAVIDAHPRSARAALGAIVDNYVTAFHRDHVEMGCASAALVADAGRHGLPAQREYNRGLEGYIDAITGVVADLAQQAGGKPDKAKARARAIAIFSQMVGTLVIARAVAQANPTLSDEVIQANRRDLKRR